MTRVAVRAVQTAVPLVLVTLWYLATTRWGVSRILLPNPVEVLHALANVLATGEFIDDLRVTLYELVVAFAISATGGVAIGFLISRTGFRIRVYEPLLSAVYAVPLILFLPLYVLWGFALAGLLGTLLCAVFAFTHVSLRQLRSRP